MGFLQSLTFTTLDSSKSSEIARKRVRLADSLSEQLARYETPNLTKTRKKWVSVNGEKHLHEVTIPVRPWWRITDDGKIAFFMKSGLKKIEFESGKAAILVPSSDDLPILIKGLIAATERGELDHLLSAQEQKNDERGVPKINKKKAA